MLSIIPQWIYEKKRQEPIIEQRLAELLKVSELKNIDDLLEILPEKANLNMELLRLVLVEKG